MQNLILYFPMGAGGNMIKNILSLDPSFEFLDDNEFLKEYTTADSRASFTLDFYKKQVDSTNWLTREWSIRARNNRRYYNNNEITYWNPNSRLIYLTHGDYRDLWVIATNRQLANYNRDGMSGGIDSEAILTTGIKNSSSHVFIIPRDIKFVTDIYQSKNYVLNQFSHISDPELRYQECLTLNTTHNNCLKEMYNHLKDTNDCYLYTAEELFRDTGIHIIYDLIDKLDLKIDKHTALTIFSLWLQSTRELYYNTHTKQL